jgi:hypothetical protein
VQVKGLGSGQNSSWSNGPTTAAAQPAQGTSTAPAATSTNAGSSVVAASSMAPAPSAPPDPPHVVLAVTRKLPQFRIEDSYDLAKVAEAMKLVTKDMVFHTKDFLDRSDWAPSPETAGHSADTNDAANCETAGLGAAGAYVSEEAGAGTTFLKLGACPPPAQPTAKTAGVAWGMDGGWVIFVTLDGGRYRFGPQKLEQGTIAASAMSAYRHRLLREWQIQELAKIGQQDAQAALDAANPAGKAWSACANKIWDAAQPEYDANGAAALMPDAKRARAEKITARYQGMIDAQCGAMKRTFSDTFKKFLGARQALRTAIFEDAKARLLDQ